VAGERGGVGEFLDEGARGEADADADARGVRRAGEGFGGEVAEEVGERGEGGGGGPEAGYQEEFVRGGGEVGG